MIKIIEFLTRMNALNRSWTKDETKEYQKMNDELLKELNATLRPPAGKKTGKIGIFLFGQAGDLATATGVLKYIDVLFPNKEIIWYANLPNADALRYSNVSEVRAWLWAGNGLPIGCPDYYPLLCVNNRLNMELKSQYPGTYDLEDGYFPAPHMVSSEKQDGIDYADCAKMIFGVPKEWEWHPVLQWSDEEREMVRSMMDSLPKGRKNILIENYCGSGQSAHWNEDTTRKIMKICREKLGDVNFIFASHKSTGMNGADIMNSSFFDDIGCIGLEKLTVRQASLAINYCDLMVCMSSGISVSTSAWGLRPVPKLQFCGSRKCSTVALANGTIDLVTTDFKHISATTIEFENKLKQILQTLC